MSHHEPRYQCPLCERFHPESQRPRCGTHGLGYSPRCQGCVHSAANPPCGGQS